MVERFVDQHRELAAWLERLDEDTAARANMTSPFARVVAYSVLDGCRLLLAHDRRHVEQARRVLQAAESGSGHESRVAGGASPST